MTIEERMNRNEVEDKIYFGEIAKSALSGEFGFLFKAIIEGLKDEVLTLSSKENSTVNADRALGRLEAFTLLQQRFDYCVQAMEELKADIKEEKRV